MPKVCNLFYAQNQYSYVRASVSGPYRYIYVPCRRKLRPLRLEFVVDVIVLIVEKEGPVRVKHSPYGRETLMGGRRWHQQGVDTGDGQWVPSFAGSLVSYTSQSHVVLITDIFPNAQSLSRAVTEPTQELCESRGGRPWLIVPRLHGLCGRR